MALENANKKITCSAIALGYFDRGIINQVPPEMKTHLLATIPLGRFGRVDELFSAVKFLIENEYITGQVISLNGGLLMA